MSIKVVWDNPEQTIIRFIYDGPWTIDELHMAMEQAWSLQDKVQHTVNTIVDVRQSGLVPQGILSQGRPLLGHHHPNQEKTVIVGANTLIRALFHTCQKIYTPAIRNYTLVETLDEAYELLRPKGSASVSTGPLRHIHP